TPRQLLGDVAGVHRIRGDNNDNVPRGHCTTLSEAVETVAGEPLAFEPGTKYRFSTYGWILLSAAIGSVTGEPFPVFMHREVFAPLGMDRTGLEGVPLNGSTRSDADAEDDTVSFYALQSAMGVKTGVDASPEADYSCFFGAGGFFSTPSDLARL